MIRLVRMEILRLWSRRLLKVSASAVLLLVTAIVMIDGAQSSKRDAAAFERFKAERLAGYDAFVAANPPAAGDGFPSRADVERDPAGSCFAAPITGDAGPGDVNACGSPPKQPYVTVAKLPDFGRAVAVICAFAAFLIGASAAGAEWSAGTMASLLYWEPRRVRVVLAKVLGLVIVIGMLVIAAEALFSALALGAGSARGTTAGLTSGVWMSYLLLVGRAALFAGFAATLGFSIAFATRATAAAVGIAFVYFAILENLLVAWKVWLSPYVIGRLLFGWLENGSFVRGSGNEAVALTGVRSGITLAIYGLVMLIAATVWFRQRDVT